MENQELIDLTEIIDKLYKSFQKLWKICLCIIMLCIILMELKVLVFYHPTYTSSMTIIASDKESNILVTSDDTEEMNKAFQRAIMSSSMQKVIQEDLGLTYLPASLNVSLIPDTNFLVVSSTASSKEDAYQVVKSIEANYGQITKLMNDAHLIIIDEPKIAEYPDTSPQYLNQGIKGCMVGLMISCFLIIAYGLSRRTVFKEEHIKKKFHLKCLGNIPLITIKKRSYQFQEQLLVTNQRIPSSFKESFRTITMAIQRKKDHQIIMVTSTLPNEGKSTISSNIALSLANDKKKVLLIDFDLRNPSLHRIFKNIHLKYQLENYLDHYCSLKDIINKSEIHDQLDFIIGTKSYDNSIEILSRDMIEEMLTKLRKQYDYIIIDVPPVEMMQDALEVAKYCDSIILTIKQDYAKTYEIVDALDELYSINGHIMGCILNGVQKSIFDEDAKGYGYGYGYGKS